MDCAKQAQRLANRVKAADCVAPRGGESAAMNERMGRHGVVVAERVKIWTFHHSEVI